MQEFFIGVDGGATKSIIRVEDADGNLIGQANSGPANIRNSVSQTWQSINSALEKILLPQGIFLENKTHRLHAGMGLAGTEVEHAYQAFLRQSHHFSTLIVASDAHAACLGAHGGKDGAIIAIGTGIVGYAIGASQTYKVGGWGFPQDDSGSGAWLGLKAIKKTLHWLDGREGASNLSQAVYAHFNKQKNTLVSWVNQTNSTGFAEIAPIVIQQAQKNDAHAIELIQKAANHAELIANALLKHATSEWRLALLGGIAQSIEPYLPRELQNKLIACSSPAEAGAILLIRNHLSKQQVLHG